MIYVLYLFFKRSVITAVSYRTGMALGVIGSLLGILQFSFMGKFLSDGNSFPALRQYNGSLLAYLIIGTVFTGFVGIALNAFQRMVRTEQQLGTLEYYLLSDIRLEYILLINGFISYMLALINMGVLLIVFAYVFDVHLGANLLAAIVTLSLTVASLSGIGLMSAGVIIVTKVGDPISWALTSLTGLLSGVLFPVEYLPPYLRAVSNVLPTTYALHALRMSLISGAEISAIIPELKLLALMACVTLPLGILVVRMGLDRARKLGSLSQY